MEARAWLVAMVVVCGCAGGDDASGADDVESLGDDAAVPDAGFGLTPFERQQQASSGVPWKCSCAISFVEGGALTRIYSPCAASEEGAESIAHGSAIGDAPAPLTTDRVTCSCCYMVGRCYRDAEDEACELDPRGNALCVAEIKPQLCAL